MSFKDWLESLHKKDETFAYSLKIEKSFFSNGKGGQNVNRHLNGVRLYHRESKIMVSIHDERSIIQNAEKAVKEMSLRLTKYYSDKAKIHFREQTVPLGDKIRTYNEKRGQCTDNRTNKTYQLDKNCTLDPGVLDACIKDNIMTGRGS
jgi:protein subunit release factor A